MVSPLQPVQAPAIRVCIGVVLLVDPADADAAAHALDMHDVAGQGHRGAVGVVIFVVIFLLTLH